MLFLKTIIKGIGWLTIIFGAFLIIRMQSNSNMYPSILPYITLALGIILVILAKLIKNFNRFIVLSILFILTYALIFIF